MLLFPLGKAHIAYYNYNADNEDRAWLFQQVVDPPVQGVTAPGEDGQAWSYDTEKAMLHKVLRYS